MEWFDSLLMTSLLTCGFSKYFKTKLDRYIYMYNGVLLIAVLV